MSKIATGKVFGIGLAKTGTVSLAHSLKMLGYNTIHQPQPRTIPILLKKVEKHDASVGWMIGMQYKELDKLYPNSKFILTLRPIRDWLRSYDTWQLGTVLGVKGLTVLQKKFYKCDYFDKEIFRRRYKEHIEDVKEYFKDRRKDLLIFQFHKDHTWDQLCKFLNKPMPREWINQRPTDNFPHLNPNKLKWKQMYNMTNEKYKWDIEEKYDSKKVMIFGVGFMRTGTSSLTRALRELGYNIIHPPRPALLPDMLKEVAPSDGANDSPIAFQYKKLYRMYPNAKWILTTRKLETWLKSVGYFLNTIYDSGADDRIRKLLYGSAKFDEEKYREAFIRHHKEVKEYFKDKELLVMNLDKGGFTWEKLCKFLNKPIPDTPFPHDHTTEDVKKWWGNESKN